MQTDAVTADDRAFVASVAEPGRSALPALDGLDPQRLSAAGRVDALIGYERLIGWAQAQQYRLMAAMLEDPLGMGSDTGALDGVDADKQWAREDVQAALGISAQAASTKLAHAHDLVHRFPDTLAAVEAGDASADKARAILDAVVVLPEQAAQQVQAEALLHIADTPLPTLRRHLHAAVIAADPAAADRQRKRGVAERRVVVRPEAPGIAGWWALLPAEGSALLQRAVQQCADSLGRTDAAAGDDRHRTRTADQRRADALVELGAHYLGLAEGSTIGTGDRPTSVGGTSVHVTVALSTLLGLDEQPGELDGHGPIPAALARDLAADPNADWRRLLTDERGVLLDYGRTTYRPPAPLQRFVRARDRTCRFPTCNQPAARCELDHRRRWTDLGGTSAANLEALSGRHHHAKDDHGWRPTRRRDGTTEWRAPTGHHYLVPPATYPVDRTTSGPGAGGNDPPPY